MAVVYFLLVTVNFPLSSKNPRRVLLRMIIHVLLRWGFGSNLTSICLFPSLQEKKRTMFEFFTGDFESRAFQIVGFLFTVCIALYTSTLMVKRMWQKYSVYTDRCMQRIVERNILELGYTNIVQSISKDLNRFLEGNDSFHKKRPIPKTDFKCKESFSVNPCSSSSQEIFLQVPESTIRHNSIASEGLTLSPSLDFTRLCSLYIELQNKAHLSPDEREYIIQKSIEETRSRSFFFRAEHSLRSKECPESPMLWS